MTLRRTSNINCNSEMVSDYIYIFCIPSSSSARLSTPEYHLTSSSADACEGTLNFGRAESCIASNDLLECPLSKRINSLTSQSPSEAVTDCPNDRISCSSGDPQLVASPVDHEYQNCSHSPQNVQLQSSLACSPQSSGSGLSTLELSPSTLSPNSRDVVSPAADSFLLRNEPWFTLPPYSPSVSRTTMRRNIRRSARTNLDGPRCPRRSRRTGHLFLISASEEGDKQCCSRSCCLHFLLTITSFRWILLFFALVGVSCILSGIVLGSLHMAVGNSFLTLSIMFIGLGVLLVIVIGIGWRCTPSGHEPCHMLFNISDHLLHTSSARDRHLRRLRHHNGDQNQWFGGVIYPEFEYRTPPPSYNDSVHDTPPSVQHSATVHSTSRGLVPDSPPPSYRSTTGTLYMSAHVFPPQCDADFQPPSYRRHGHHRTPLESVTIETVPVALHESPLQSSTVSSDLCEGVDVSDEAVLKVLASNEFYLAENSSERMKGNGLSSVQRSSLFASSFNPSVSLSSDGVSPVLHLPLSSDESWQHRNSVSST